MFDYEKSSGVELALKNSRFFFAVNRAKNLAFFAPRPSNKIWYFPASAEYFHKT